MPQKHKDINARKEEVRRDLKIVRHLVELLPMTGSIPAFDYCHADEFFMEDALNLSSVLVILNEMYDAQSCYHKNSGKVNSKLIEACTFVAPKEEEALKDLASELSMRRMVREEGPKLYKEQILPIILEMIDLALKKDEARGE